MYRIFKLTALCMFAKHHCVNFFDFFIEGAGLIGLKLAASDIPFSTGSYTNEVMNIEFETDNDAKIRAFILITICANTNCRLQGNYLRNFYMMTFAQFFSVVPTSIM